MLIIADPKFYYNRIANQDPSIRADRFGIRLSWQAKATALYIFAHNKAFSNTLCVAVEYRGSIGPAIGLVLAVNTTTTTNTVGTWRQVKFAMGSVQDTESWVDQTAKALAIERGVLQLKPRIEQICIYSRTKTTLRARPLRRD